MVLHQRLDKIVGLCHQSGINGFGALRISWRPGKQCYFSEDKLSVGLFNRVGFTLFAVFCFYTKTSRSFAILASPL